MAKATPPAVIIAAGRTPIGTARKGSLAQMEASALAIRAVAGVINRSGLDAAEFDDLRGCPGSRRN